MENETVQVQDVKEDTTTPASEEKQVVNSVPYARFKEKVTENNELKTTNGKLTTENEFLKKEKKESIQTSKCLREIIILKVYFIPWMALMTK